MARPSPAASVLARAMSWPAGVASPGLLLTARTIDESIAAALTFRLISFRGPGRADQPPRRRLAGGAWPGGPAPDPRERMSDAEQAFPRRRDGRIPGPG